MLLQRNEADAAQSQKARDAIAAWAVRVDTVVLETPEGDWYAIFHMWDGNRPMLQYLGMDEFAAWTAVHSRADAVYGPRPRLFPNPDLESE